MTAPSLDRTKLRLALALAAIAAIAFLILVYLAVQMAAYVAETDPPLQPRPATSVPAGGQVPGSQVPD